MANESLTKKIIGILTDENEMSELLEKFVAKEGFITRLLTTDHLNTNGLSLVILAPARDTNRFRKLSESLKRDVPVVLVDQYDEGSDIVQDDTTVVLSEHPLNLKRLSEIISSMLKVASGERTAK